MTDDIIPSGLQIACNRKNAYRTDDKKLDVVIDSKELKFYESIVSERKKLGEKSEPMFHAKLRHWDSDGNIVDTVISFKTLSPESVKLIHDVMMSRLAAPKPKSVKIATKEESEESKTSDSGDGVEGEANASTSSMTEPAVEVPGPDESPAEEPKEEQEAEQVKKPAEEKKQSAGEKARKLAAEKAEKTKAEEPKPEPKPEPSKPAVTDEDLNNLFD